MSINNPPESFTFELMGTNISESEKEKITGDICTMIANSLNSKLEGFKTDLSNISDNVLKKMEEDW